MKITILLACTCIILSNKEVVGSAIKAPLDIISLDDITPEERKELAYLQHKLGRPKRSGSGDLLETLKTAIGQGIKKKLGQFAQGSASASGHLSSSSSGSSSGHGYSHHPPPKDDHKSFDFWTLKKSILNTLLQAVKAIKGGVIAVKGQLIKGGGHLISAKGKLISAKGEAITHLGKNIASSAVLVPFNGHPSSGHADYGHSESHYSAPSAPEDIYHASPSAPGPEYHETGHYHPTHHEEHEHHGGHEGILILKKIVGKNHHHHVAEEKKVPSFKPIAPSGPSFGTIVGKFFSASSSTDPHKPELFGHTASSNIHYASPSHSESHHYHDKPDNHEVHPSNAGYAVDEDQSEPEVIYSKKPTSSYDSPFEHEPSYLSQNFDDHSASASKNNPQAVKSNSVSAESLEKPTKHPSKDQELPKPYTSSQSFSQTNFDFPTKTFQSLQNPSSGTFSEGNYNVYTGNVDLPNISDYPNGFPGELIPQSSTGELPASFLDQTPTGANPFAQTAIDLSSDVFPQTAPEFMFQQYNPNEAPNFQMHSSKPALYLQTPKEDFYQHTPSHPHKSPTRLVYVDKPSSSKHKYKSAPPGHPVYLKRPSSTRTTHKHKPKQTYDVVRSIGYQLGPNGPKKLT